MKEKNLLKEAHKKFRPCWPGPDMSVVEQREAQLCDTPRQLTHSNPPTGMWSWHGPDAIFQGCDITAGVCYRTSV